MNLDEEATFFLIGVICGVLIVFACLSFIPNPIYVDCGCGAQSSMCMNCIKSGNLSSDICSWFVNR